jgi:ABC-2 type transport system ATP-binding protein
MPERVVEIEGVSRKFSRTLALDGVTVSVRQGCVHGLVGANGAGKTTLIKHVLGLLRAKSGSVRVFGLDPVKHPVEVLRRIGYLSEERDLPDWMRLHELMRYTQAYHANWDSSYADELLRTFGLDPSKKVKELSRGMRAQTGLIAAVAHRPDLLLLDEPSTGLDAVVRRDILNEIVRAVADEGRTALFSSHLLDEVEQMSDYVTMIHEGRVVLDGELDTIKEDHHLLSVSFEAPLPHAPELDGALSVDGHGRTWSVMCNGAVEQVRQAMVSLKGAIVDERNASLQEIFVARVGRRYLPEED